MRWGKVYSTVQCTHAPRTRLRAIARNFILRGGALPRAMERGLIGGVGGGSGSDGAAGRGAVMGH